MEIIKDGHCISVSENPKEEALLKPLTKLGILKNSGDFEYTIGENLEKKLIELNYDCLNCAEAIMKYWHGVPDMEELTPSSKTTFGNYPIGNTDDENIQSVKSESTMMPKKNMAFPNEGDAYFICALSDSEEEPMSPYHAAAVILRYSNLNVTLEGWERNCWFFKIYGKSKGSCFHTMYKDYFESHDVEALTVGISLNR